MAKYTDAQLDQFMKDNDEVLTLAKDAGISLDQLKDGALNMSAFDPSWGETLKAGGKAAVAGFKKQGLGLARAATEGALEEDKPVEFLGKEYTKQQLGSGIGDVIRDLVGKEVLQKTADTLATEDANVSRKLSDEMPYIDDPDALKATVIDAIGGIVPTAATGLAAGLLTRSPAAAAAAVGGGSFGTYYGQSRDKGLTPEESRERAARFAAMEGASEALPFASAMGKLGGKGLLSTIGKTAVSEGAQEGATDIAQAVHDKIAYGEELPDDLLQQAWRSAKAGALGGGLMGAGGHMLNFDPKVEEQAVEAKGAVNPNAVDLGQPEAPTRVEATGATDLVIEPEATAEDVTIGEQPEMVPMDTVEQVEPEQEAVQEEPVTVDEISEPEQGPKTKASNEATSAQDLDNRDTVNNVGNKVTFRRDGDDYAIEEDDEVLGKMSFHDVKISSGMGGVYRNDLILNMDGEFVSPNQIVQAGSRTLEQTPYKGDANGTKKAKRIAAEIAWADKTGNHELSEKLSDAMIDHVNGKDVDVDSILNQAQESKRKETEEKPVTKKPSEAKKETKISEIDTAANEAATSPTNEMPEPTEAQKEAGNYKHGHVKVDGIDIAIENPKGSKRSGTDEDGNEWSVDMKNHYGRIKKTEGADGDQVDVFIGNKPESGKVFVVNQNNPKTGKFDEHKVMMGFETEEQAVKAYNSNYSKDWKGFDSAVEMSTPEFKAWLKDSDTKKPAVSEFKNALTSIKSGKQMNEWLGRNAKDPVHRGIAERISNIIGDDLKIVPVKKGDYAPVNMRRAKGVYSNVAGKEKIYLWNDKTQSKNADELTVMHELVHAATAISIRKGTAEPNTELGKRVSELDSLRKEVLNNLRSRRAKDKLTDLEKSKAGKQFMQLGFANNDEFVAWGMTDPNAQKILKSIQVTPRETAWTKFVVSLAKILGIKPSSTNALAQLIETTDHIMSAAEKAADIGSVKLSQQTKAIGVAAGVTEQEAEKVREKFNPEPKLAPHKELLKKAKEAKSEGAKDLVSSVKSEIRRGMIDKYEPIKKLEDQMYADGTLTDVTSSAWRMANTIHAAHGVMSVLFDYGKVKYDPVKKVILPATKNEGGLKKVLSQLDEPNELGDFFMWIASNRANEINQRSKAAQTKIDGTRAEIKNLKEMLTENTSKATQAKLLKAIKDGESKINELKKKADVKERFLDEETIRNGMLLDTMQRKDGSSREALFDKVLNEFNEYRESVLKVAEGTGIITSENREMWSDQFYVPFYRVMENDTKIGPHPTPGLSRQDAIKKLKGSQKQLGDLFDNTLMNFNFLIDASLRNRAAAQAIENAELAGIATETTEHKKGEQATYIMRDGKKVWYDISDPAYFAAVTATGMTKMPFQDNPIMKLANKSKVAFTKLTTVVPKFSLAMIVKDAILAPALGKVGMAKGGALRGAYKYGMGGISDVKAEMLTTGASFDLGYDAQDRKKKLDKEFQHYKDKVVPIQHALGALKGMADYYGDFQNMAENANRAAIFMAAKEDGKSELDAAFESADMQNFSQSGAWATMRFLNGIVPFLNVGMQGIDKTARSFGNVFKTISGVADQETKNKAVRFATVASVLSTASIALALQNSDDDEYKELPEYMKNTYWFLRFGDRKGEFFLIPKPFTIGSVINVSEKITDNITGVSKAEGTLDYVRQVALDTLNVNPLPQLAKPLVELYMNKNMFTGQPIENQRDLRYSPKERFDYKTSELAKFFGNDKLSPKQVDHLMKAYFSSGGEVVSEGIDLIVNAFSDNPRPEKYWYERSVFTRFYSDRTAPTFTKSQQRFYKMYDEFIQAKNDFKRAADMGDRAKAENILKAKGYKIQLAPMLDKYKRKIGKVTKQIEATRNNKLMSAEEKRQTINMLNATKANMYQEVVKVVDSVTKEIDDM
ncbi:hypothetical protein DMW20_11745 [Vibrio parahaemolyticus]|nr:hypothetical protein [Vibrio parahaemolyticus]